MKGSFGSCWEGKESDITSLLLYKHLDEVLSEQKTLMKANKTKWSVKMKYLKLLLIIPLIVSVITTKAQAEKIGSCMTAECIDYFHKWKVMASAKRVLAMSTLADFYYLGYGTEKNLEQSIRYYRKASRFQFTYAQYRAGLFYLTEEAFIDHSEGIKYLKKAARNGHLESAFILGVIYGTGKLADKDVDESDKWLVKALEGEHATAQKYANYLYNSGQVDKDNYMKVNELISELNLDFTESEQSVLSKNTTEIQWPEKSGIEVIEVSAPSMAAIFDYELNELKKAAPATNIATGTRIQGRKCEQIFSCEFTSQEDLLRWGI